MGGEPDDDELFADDGEPDDVFGGSGNDSGDIDVFATTGASSRSSRAGIAASIIRGHDRQADPDPW